MKEVLDEVPASGKKWGIPACNSHQPDRRAKATLNVLTGEQGNATRSSPPKRKIISWACTAAHPGPPDKGIMARAVGDEPVKADPADRLELRIRKTEEGHAPTATTLEDQLSFALSGHARDFFELVNGGDSSGTA